VAKPPLDTPVDETFARKLIATQFPALGDASIRHIGEGWDNAAYLVAEHLVFRFPQRKICGPLVQKEIANLPMLAPLLPYPIPVPLYSGKASDEYPYPFVGYELLYGAPADTRQLNESEHRQLARDLGRFLRALHNLDPAPFRALGLPDDEIGKLDPKRLGVDEAPLEGEPSIVHGDLYEKHLLLDHRNRLCGVIDWGDLHFGLPAVDLSSVHMVLPAHAHDEFFAKYGNVDDRSWRFAAHRARYHQAMRA
jgi:aminoglycoside phosphotransferase (APT) family kinase protein